MVSLGTLEIGLRLNKSAFDRDYKAVQSMMSQKGLSTVIKPRVDHSELEMLNRHIDIKIKHIKQLRAEANKPITLKTSANPYSEGTQSREAHNSQFKQLDLSVIYRGLSSINSSLKQIVKNTGQTQKNTKKSIPSIKTAIVQGIGQNITMPFSSGLLKGLEKSLGIDSRKLGNISGKFTGKIASVLRGATIDAFQGAMSAYGIDDLGIEINKIIKESVLDALEKGGSFQDVIKNIQVGIKKRQGGVFQKGQGIVRNLRDTDNLKDVGLSFIGSIGQSVSPVISKALSDRRIKKSQDSIDLVLARLIEIENEVITKRPNIDKAMKRLEKLKAKGKTKIEGVSIEDIVFGKEAGVSSLAAIDDETKELFITTGGYGNIETTGHRIAGYIMEQSHKQGKKGVRAIGVANPDTYLGNARDDERLATMGMASVLGRPHVRGYSKDAIEITAQALAAIQKNPEIKIKIVGESGGGFPAEEAVFLLNQMGFEKNVEGIGIGTPNLIGAFPDMDNFTKYLAKNSEEELGVQAHEIYAPLGLANVKPRSQNLTGATQHPYEGYRHLSPIENFLGIDYENPNIPDLTPQFGQINVEDLQNYLQEIKKDTSLNIEQILNIYKTVNKRLSNKSISSEQFGGDIDKIKKELSIFLDNPELAEQIRNYEILIDSVNEKIQQIMLSGSNNNEFDELINNINKSQLEIKKKILTDNNQDLIQYEKRLQSLRSEVQQIKKITPSGQEGYFFLQNYQSSIDDVISTNDKDYAQQLKTSLESFLDEFDKDNDKFIINKFKQKIKDLENVINPSKTKGKTSSNQNQEIQKIESAITNIEQNAITAVESNLERIGSAITHKADEVFTTIINQILAYDFDPNTININPRQIESLSDLGLRDVLSITGKGAQGLGLGLKSSINTVVSGALPATRAGYGMLQGAENFALSMIPYGHLAKGVAKNTLLPAAAFGAATHFLPGAGMMTEGAINMASSGLQPLIQGVGTGLTSSLVEGITSSVPLIGEQLGESITTAITGASGAIADVVAGAGITMLGGKALMQLPEAAGKALLTPDNQQNIKALPQSSQRYSQATLQVLTQFENTARQMKALYGETVKGQLSSQKIKALPSSELTRRQESAKSIARVGQYLLQDYDEVIKQLPKSEKFGELGRRIANIKNWVENSNKFLERSGARQESIPDRQLLQLGERKESEKRGEFLVSGLADGVESSYEELRQSVQVLGQLALDEFDDVLDISSPSKQMKKRGIWTVEGLMEGFENAKGKLRKTWRSIISSMNNVEIDNNIVESMPFDLRQNKDAYYERQRELMGVEKAQRQNKEINTDLSINQAQKAFSDEYWGDPPSEITEEIENINNELKRVERQGNKTTNFLSNVKKIILGLGASIVFTNILNVLKNISGEAIQTYASFESINAQLKLVKDGEQYFEDIKKQVSSLGGNLKETTQQAIQFDQALLGGRLQDSSKSLFLDLNQSLLSLQLGSEATERAILAVTQMASKGKISMEEILQLAESGVPGGLNMMAQAFGGTTESLIAQVSSGNVLAEELLPKFIAQIKQNTNILAGELEGSITAVMSRVDFQREQFMLNIGAEIAPTTYKALDVFSNAIKLINDNFDTIKTGVDILIKSTIILLTPWKLILDFVKTIAVQIFSLKRSTTQWGAILKTISVTIKSISRTLLILGAIQLITELWSKGSTKVRDVNKDIEKTINSIANAYRNVKKERKKAFEDNNTADYAEGLFGAKLNFKYDEGGFRGFLDKLNPLNYQAVIGAGTVGAEQYTSYGDLMGRERLKEIDQGLNTIMQGFGFTTNLFNQDETNKFIESITVLDEKIQGLEGRSRALRLIDAQGNKNEIASIEEELNKLNKQRQELSEDFLPAGQQGLESFKQQIELFKSTLLDLESEGLNVGQPLKEVEFILGLINKALNKNQDVNDAITNQYNQQRKALIEMLSYIAKVDSQTTINQANRRANLYSLQANNQLSSQATQLGLANLDVLANQENLNNLQQFQKQRENILNQISEDTRSTLETISGQSLNDIDAGGLTKIQQYLQDAPQSQKKQVEDIVGILQEYVQTTEQIAQTNEQLAQSQSNLNQQIRQTAIERQNFVKTVIDFNRTLEDFEINTNRQIIDFERSVYDYKFSIDQFNIDQSRSLRGLQESYDDLYLSIEQQTLTAENQIRETIRQINRIELENRLADINPLGVENPLQGALNSIQGISDALDAFESATDQQTETRLSVEQETLNIARQIRSLQEQQEDMERQRNQSVRQFQIQAEQLQRQQEDFNRNQKRQWEDILYQASQIAQQAYELGVVMNDVGLGLAEQGEGLIKVIRSLADGIQAIELTSISSSGFTSPSGTVYEVGNIGPTSTGPHVDLKRRDRQYFERDAYDQYIQVNGRPLSSGVTVAGGTWDAHQRRNSHGWDYAFPEGADVTLHNGAKVIDVKKGGKHGDVLVIKVPTGEELTIIHGKATQGVTPVAQQQKTLPTPKNGLFQTGISPKDYEKLLRISVAEAGGEGITGMALVINSILNRQAMILSGKVKPSDYNAKSAAIGHIIEGEDQYQPVSNPNSKYYKGITDEERRQAELAFQMAYFEALNPQLKARGYSQQKRMLLLSATGFRTHNAKNDNSQNYNTASFKGHRFNADQFSRQVNVPQLRRDVNKLTYPTNQPTTQPVNIPITEVTSVQRPVIDLPPVRTISISNNPPQFNGQLLTGTVQDPNSLIKPLTFDAPDLTAIEAERQRQIEEQERIKIEETKKQLESQLNRSNRQYQSDAFNIGGQNIQILRGMEDFARRWRDITINAKGYLTISERIAKAGEDAAQPFRELSRELEDSIRTNEQILNVGLNAQKLEDFYIQIERIKNNTELTSEKQAEYISQIEELIKLYQSGEFENHLKLKQKELEINKQNKEVIDSQIESERKLAEQRKRLEEQFNRSQGLFNIENEALQSEQRLMGSGKLFDRARYEQIMFENSDDAIKKRIKDDITRLGLDPIKDAADIDRLTESYQRLQESSIANAFYEASPALQQFEDALLGVLTGTQSLEDAFKSLFTTIATEIIKMTLIRPIINSLSGLFGGLFGGGLGIGVSAAFDVGTSFALPAFADGGSVQEALRKERVASGNNPVLAVVNDGEYVVSANDGQLFEDYKMMRKMNNLSLKYQAVKNYNQGGFINSNYGRNTQPQSSGITYVVNSNNSINVQSPTLVGESLTQIENRQNEQLQRANRRFG